MVIFSKTFTIKLCYYDSTNWFQIPSTGLTPPHKLKINKKNQLEISWDTAYAADAPLSHYEIFKGGKKVAPLKHQPQITKQPFAYKDHMGKGEYWVVTVDKAGNWAESERLKG